MPREGYKSSSTPIVTHIAMENEEGTTFAAFVIKLQKKIINENSLRF